MRQLTITNQHLRDRTQVQYIATSSTCDYFVSCCADSSLQCERAGSGEETTRKFPIKLQYRVHYVSIIMLVY